MNRVQSRLLAKNVLRYWSDEKREDRMEESGVLTFGAEVTRGGSFSVKDFGSDTVLLPDL